MPFNTLGDREEMTRFFNDAVESVVDGVVTWRKPPLGQGWVDVRAFGAKGDGVTDDTAAIQAALSTVPANRSAIYLPPDGVFLCGPLTAPYPVDIFGGGRLKLGTTTPHFLTVLADDVRFSRIALEGTDTANVDEELIYCNTAHHRGVIEGCLFTKSVMGVHVNGSTISTKPRGWRIVNNTFLDMGLTSNYAYGYGVLLPDVEQATVALNTFTNINRHAVYLSSGASHCVVSENTIRNVVYSDAIKVASFAGGNRCADNLVLNNIVDGAAYGVNLSGGVDYTLVQGNKIKGVTDIHLYVNGASGGPYPTGNILRGNDLQGACVRAILQTNAEQTVIEGNTGHISTSGAFAILINDTGTWTTTGGWVARLTDNDITALTSYGLQLNYTANADPVYLGEGNRFVLDGGYASIAVTNGTLTKLPLYPGGTGGEPVVVQDATPGTAQTGHANLSGTMLLGGALGIGNVSSPVGAINIKKDGTTVYAVERIENANSTAILDIGVGGASVVNPIQQNTAFLINQAASALVLAANGADYQLVLMPTHTVGIGTAGALAKLAINGGLHVGGDSDPGDNNATVDGVLTAASLVLGGLAYTASYGANDSAGAGFRTVSLKVPNA